MQSTGSFFRTIAVPIQNVHLLKMYMISFYCRALCKGWKHIVTLLCIWSLDTKKFVIVIKHRSLGIISVTYFVLHRRKTSACTGHPLPAVPKLRRFSLMHNATYTPWTSMETHPCIFQLGRALSTVSSEYPTVLPSCYSWQSVCQKKKWHAVCEIVKNHSMSPSILFSS